MGALNCCCAKYSEKTAVPQSSSDTTCPIRITRSGDHCALLETPWSLLELASSCCMPAAAVSKSSGRSSISSSSERFMHTPFRQWRDGGSVFSSCWRKRNVLSTVLQRSLSTGFLYENTLLEFIKNVLVWHPLVSVSVCVCMCVCMCVCVVIPCDCLSCLSTLLSPSSLSNCFPAAHRKIIHYYPNHAKNNEFHIPGRALNTMADAAAPKGEKQKKEKKVKVKKPAGLKKVRM